MANTQAMCSSFREEILLGEHDLDNDTINAAVYLASASLGAGTTGYSSTGEATGDGYSAGGVAVTNGTVALDGTTAHWTPGASIEFEGVTLTAVDAILLYNATASNQAISVHTFGSTSVTDGTLRITMPTDDGSTGLIRIGD